MNFYNNLNKILARHKELSEQLANPSDNKEFVAISKEYARLDPIVLKIQAYYDATKNLESVQTMIDQESDPDMQAMIKNEISDLQKQIPILEDSLKISLLPKDEADHKNVIIEIRGGTGGEESALFVSDLFRMYQYYASIMGWKLEILTLSTIGIGGYREVSALIKGNNVFAKLKFESGVHRVQRIPQTESSGRIHTSAATVSVMPEAEELDLVINENDVRTDTYRSSGPGGQHANTTDSAVRLTHLPTKIVVTIQDEKSQHKNKAKAMKILRARLYDAQRQEAQKQRSNIKKQQIGSGDRSERIRTYNFPQSRITDHRINLTLYKIDEILNSGNLDLIIDPLIYADNASKLAE